jgi:hypothetical protein
MMKHTKRKALHIIPFLMLLLLISSVKDSYGKAANLDIYVANDQSQCAGKEQCFYNDEADTVEAIALNKAIRFAKENNLLGANIHIISPYKIKTHQVVIDFPINLIGENGGWLSTSSTICDQAMLEIKAQVTIKDIYLTDGACANPSRDLLRINSPSNVLIEHSTLVNGAIAILHQNNTGNLTIRTSEIKNNSIALRSENTEVASKLVMVANNIIGNGTPQVRCTNNSQVDHNYWGEGILPSQAAQNCVADNKKVLGTKILSEQVGVAARLLDLPSSYPTNDFYGLSAKSTGNSRLYVVNHSDQTPFPGSNTRTLNSCGNYFDIFLPEGENPSSISLKFKYDQNTNCVQAVQSLSLCGSGSSTRYPLMWFDPKTSVTDGWDNVGDTPQTEAGDIFSGQEVRCDLQSKSIEAIIDNDGRPDLLNDLHYTPFVVGYEITTVMAFRPTEDTPGIVNLDWGTGSEPNTNGFQITRATSENGEYKKIGEVIPKKGSATNGGVYKISDNTVAPSTTYYYLLEVIDIDGSVQQVIGPLKITTKADSNTTTTPTRTSTPTGTIYPTSTRIPTRTPTQFLTATSSFATLRPTYVTKTHTPRPEISATPEPTVPEFVKPTNLHSTKTTRPTIDSGLLLDKRSKSNLEEDFSWIIFVAIIISLILGMYFILTKKKR